MYNTRHISYDIGYCGYCFSRKWLEELRDILSTNKPVCDECEEMEQLTINYR